MRPGREIDARIAQEIFGHHVFFQGEELFEKTLHEVQPLRHYATDMQWAWLVAEKMRVSLMPVENGQWFAFIGPHEGWVSPEAFLEYLRGGDFSLSGAAVGGIAAQAICEASLIANQKRQMHSPSKLKSTPRLEVISSLSDSEPSGDGGSDSLH